MQFLRTFRKTWWLRMLKTISKEQIRCRGCFFEGIKAFGVEKIHQILTELDKNTKKIQGLKTLCSFCVILESLCGLEFKRHSTRNKSVFGKVFCRKKTKFCNEKKRTICDQK